MGAIFAARVVLRSASAVAVRPRLWPTAVAQLARFAPDRWWRRPPFMPLPSGELARFRSETMYGDPHAPPTPADIVRWLEWCRALNQSAPTNPHRPLGLQGPHEPAPTARPPGPARL